MGMSLIAWPIWEIPECLALTALVFSFGLKELPLAKVIIIGLLQAILVYFIRHLPLTPGVNIFIEVLVLAILFVWIVRLDVRIGLICCLTGFFLLLVLECIGNLMLGCLGGYSEQNLQDNYMLQLVVGYSRIVVILILAILNKMIKKDIFHTAWRFILK